MDEKDLKTLSEALNNPKLDNQARNTNEIS